jgi:alkaline phosphatase D
MNLSASFPPASRVLKTAFQLLIGAGLLTSVAAHAQNIFHAQGEMSGEVTQTSVILQSRLTATASPEGGDVPGIAGDGKFELSTNPKFGRQIISTAWLKAAPETDFILKTKVEGLKPGTRYHYRLVHRSGSSATPGPARTFQTLPATNSASELRFIVGNCMNYAFFHYGQQGSGKGAYTGPDKHLGYPAMEAILKADPWFFVGAGDNVYYDHPRQTRAQSVEEMRRKWHEQFVQPRAVQLFARVPAYWLKDDHDYRINDSDPTGDYEPSHETGIRIFREQVPVVDPNDPHAVTYRTHRVNQWLQIWMVEGRDYRSPNRMADGPEKTIWGAEQKAWLKQTLKESDAAFKILISPTPMVGPDDASKRDNHVNLGGFRHEGDEFFAWLKAAGIPANGFFILTGDRHWKYHSAHPSGYEEFSCGALNAENSRLGRNPGDPKSTDPDSKVKQFYTDAKPSGGFLEVSVKPGGNAKARIVFDLNDEAGKKLYSVTRSVNDE